jgi:hypothetical protein
LPTPTLPAGALRVPVPVEVVVASEVSSAAPTVAGLNTANNTGSIARVSLSGPTDAMWPLDDKQVFQPRINPGAYVATVSTVCGAAAQSFTIDAGTTKDLPLSCEPIATAAALRVSNASGTS